MQYDSPELQALDARLKTVLPSTYKDNYEDVQPVSMGSAGLKFGPDGKVAWDEIWGSFCHLAMAGGPPHKGTLLEPATPEQIAADPENHRRVLNEICRGIRLVSDVAVEPSHNPGWVRIFCAPPGMAGWLARAINIENVSALQTGDNMVDLPAGPHYRLEKEIKNVITSVAKTCHYYSGHLLSGQQRAIAALFAERDLLQPAQTLPDSNLLEKVHQATGLIPAEKHYKGWLGLECNSVQRAIWHMRALVVNHVLARREGTVLYVPVNPTTDPTGDILVNALVNVHQLAQTRGI